MIESISAITLGTHDMGRAVHFYRSLGFELLYGGEAAAFTSFRAGTGYLNLTAQPKDKRWSWWGPRHLLCRRCRRDLRSRARRRMAAFHHATRCRMG
jgi:catechol 2,3-dioxygenase-like lactoylglutathione lyase family enzyme